MCRDLKKKLFEYIFGGPKLQLGPKNWGCFKIFTFHKGDPYEGNFLGIFLKSEIFWKTFPSIFLFQVQRCILFFFFKKLITIFNSIAMENFEVSISPFLTYPRNTIIGLRQKKNSPRPRIVFCGHFKIFYFIFFYIHFFACSALILLLKLLIHFMQY